MRVSKPALNLRAFLARLVKVEQRDPVGDDLMQHDLGGNGVTTTFNAPKGWKPFMVFVDGSLNREGAGEDYTTTSDGQIWQVTFAVAPAVVDVTLVCRRIK